MPSKLMSRGREVAEADTMSPALGTAPNLG